MNYITREFTAKDGSKYTIRAKERLPYEVWVDIEAFDIIYKFEAHIYYKRKGATCSDDTTTDLNDAQRVFTAYIKWDGCSDFDFYPDRGGNDHFCGKSYAVSLGETIGSAYELALELLGDKADDEDMFNG